MSVQAWPEYPTIAESFTRNGIRASVGAVGRESVFGPFASAFEKGDYVPPYLELLGLKASPSLQTAITRIETALQQGDSARWIAVLLRDGNWRPNLVGAMAMVLDPDAADCALLWEAIDRGSWVIPQLVIAAAIVDPTIRDRIRARVAAPTNAKTLASILALCAELPDLAAWREDRLRDKRVIALLADDAELNNSDKIVASWLAQLRMAFAARGRMLVLR